MNKQEARRRARAQKSLLSECERRQAAIDVFEQLEQLAAFMMADHILMYHSLSDELSTHAFLDKWHGRKHFFLPRVNGVNLDILPYDRSRLQLGAFHIEEPEGDDTTSIDDMEMVVVPAMAYDCQIVDIIETDPYDTPVDIVITPSRTYVRRAATRHNDRR